jgi:anti-sigma-K factor RskA
LNLKEYISSGIVESYVLGLATEAERAEFEMMCKHYPEVAQAREQFELSLEATLMADAAAPPALVKENILSAIQNETASANTLEEEQQETPVRSISVWKWLAAACFILLLASLIGIYTINQKNKELEQANNDLKQQVENSTVQLNSLKSDAETLRHPMKVAALQGTQMAPQAFATVYWDTTATKDVYLLVNNLPQPASDKQYQLWALLDGQPIDLGVFDVKQERLLVRMKNVQNAQAFAITLEQKGGSPTPKGDMYVMGKL